MSNEVTLHTNTDMTLPGSYEAFMLQSEADKNRLTGQGNNLGNTLPKLRINYDAEYENKEDKTVRPIPLVRGTWKMEVMKGDTQVVAFAETVIFRPFLRTYRYSVYDAEKNTSLLNSTMFKSWGDAVIDDSGMEFKAAKYKKGVIAMRPELEGPLQCQQNLFGTVTMSDAKDMHGATVAVTDIPCVWMTKGASFMPVANTISELTERKVAMYSVAFNLTTARAKKGQVTYFTPVMAVSTQNLTFSKDDFTMLKAFSDTINGENSYILDKFKKIGAKAASNKVAVEFAGVGSNLGDDFNDAIA